MFSILVDQLLAHSSEYVFHLMLQYSSTLEKTNHYYKAFNTVFKNKNKICLGSIILNIFHLWSFEFSRISLGFFNMTPWQGIIDFKTTWKCRLTGLVDMRK